MSELESIRADTAKAIGERDYLLKLIEELGGALLQGRALGVRPTGDGVEARELYPSRGAALAAATRVRDLVALVSYNSKALAALEVTSEAQRLRA